MAVSTLAAAFNDLQGDIGFFLGYGRGTPFGEAAWSLQQQNSITRCVKGGLRNFYHCGYDWSFLKPMAAVSLATGAQVAILPDDFGGVEGRVVLAQITGSTDWWPLEFGGLEPVYHHYGVFPTTTGRPRICCIEPLKGTGSTMTQQWQLHVWPIADMAYTLKFQYYLNPDYIDGAFPYAYGGPEHAETQLESCLAVAEKILDDSATVHEMEFQKRLDLSKMIDHRRKPQNVGYNGDRSDQKEQIWWDRAGWHALGPINVNGVFF